MRSHLLIIYIPGLKDHHILNRLWIKFIAKQWEKYGEVCVFYPEWHRGHFKEKLHQIQKIIESNQKKKIILIGQSAGGSAAINAYVQTKPYITCVINIGGRLIKGTHVFPSLSLAAKGSKAFEESVLQCEKESLLSISTIDKRRISILKPLYDEVVPTSTCMIEGIKPITVPVVGHSIGGGVASLLYVPHILKRILNDFHSY